MKGYAMLKIGESGWIEKDRPECGPLDAIVNHLPSQSAHLTFIRCEREPSANATT